MEPHLGSKFGTQTWVKFGAQICNSLAEPNLLPKRLSCEMATHSTKRLSRQGNLFRAWIPTGVRSSGLLGPLRPCFASWALWAPWAPIILGSGDGRLLHGAGGRAPQERHHPVPQNCSKSPQIFSKKALNFEAWRTPLAVDLLLYRGNCIPTAARCIYHCRPVHVVQNMQIL